MTYIHTISPTDATGRLRTLYNRVKGPDGRVDNILAAHSLRPASLEGHMAIYKNVLHHQANTTPKWFLETVGVYVSLLNDCAYCVDHHFAGLKRLLADDEVATAVFAGLTAGLESGQVLCASLTPQQCQALSYAYRLTTAPAAVNESDVAELRAAGWDDGGILELNQVIAYFAYANRTVLGLGVTTQGDVLGLSPNNNDDEADWGHR